MSEIKVGAILNYIMLFIRLGIGFLLSPFILNCLGRSEFGIYTIAGTIIGWLALCDFGLSASTTKFLSEYQAKGDAEGEAHYLGNIAALFSLIGAFVLVAGLCIYPFLGDIFPKFTEEELQLYRILYLMTLFNTACMFPGRSLNGISSSRQKFIAPGVVASLASLASTAATIVLLTLGFRSIALCTTSIIIGILSMAWNVYYCFGPLKARMKWNGWDIPLCKTMFAFSLWMFLDHLIGIFNWGCGNMIIGMTQGAEQIAVYSYGLALMQYYFMSSNCISGLFLPKVVKMVTVNAPKEELTDLWIKVARVHVLILGLLLTGILLFGQQFLDLWIGDTLGAATRTTWIVAILLISTITIPLVQCLGWQIMQAYNAMKFRVKILLIVSICNLLLGYVLSIYYGAIGLALGTACSFIIGQWICMNLLYRYKMGLNVLRFFKETVSGLLIPLLYVGGVYCALQFIPTDFFCTWLGFFIAVGVYSALYCIIMMNCYARPAERELLPPLASKFLIFKP